MAKPISDFDSQYQKYLFEVAKSVKSVNSDRACIFGSFALSHQEPNDIDLLVISDEFSGVSYKERQHLLELPPRLPIDCWLYTNREFEELYPESNEVRQSIEEANIDLTKIHGHERV